MNLDKLIQAAQKNYGASLSIPTGIMNPNNGYFASYKNCEVTIYNKNLNAVRLLEYVKLHSDELLTNGNFLGLWFESKLVYIDVSKQFYSEAECIKFAKQNKQLAYYDAKNKRVIKLT